MNATRINKLIKLFAIVAVTLIMVSNINADEKKKFFKNDKGVAFSGYDVVSYFISDKPVMGKKEFSYNYQGAVMLFSNEANLKTFKKAPENYMPQYGGYCAFGLTKDAYFETDPMAYKIIDGKLYLNKNKDVQELWNKNIPNNIKQADKNYSN